MSKIEQLESDILQLPPEGFRQLADWILELDQQRWDEQFERDVSAGRLDALAEEAIADFKAGQSRPI